MPFPLLGMLSDIGNLIRSSPGIPGSSMAAGQPGFSLMGNLPPLVQFMPPEIASSPTQRAVPGSVPILPPMATPTAQPPTTVDKIVGGLEKVNRILEATPFLGHILRSTAGELQERQLPVDLQRAELLGRDRMWEEMMRNIRAREANRTRTEAARITAGATERGAKARAGATTEAARTRAIGDLIWQYQQADKGTKRIIRNALERYGINVPEEVSTEGSKGLLERALSALSGDRLRNLLSVIGGKEPTPEKGKRPPLDSFFKQ